jgi:hypothetical protein
MMGEIRLQNPDETWMLSTANMGGMLDTIYMGDVEYAGNVTFHGDVTFMGNVKVCGASTFLIPTPKLSILQILQDLIIKLTSRRLF